MSQEQPSDQRQRRLSNALRSPQRLPFVGPTPNMLPLNTTAGIRASATTNALFYPNALPFASQFLGSGPAHTPSLDLVSPSSSPYPIMTAQRQRTDEHFNSSSDFKVLAQGAGPEAIAAKANNSRDMVSTTPSLATYTPPWNRRSRLPIDNAPGKMPRKAGYIDNIDPPHMSQPHSYIAKNNTARENPIEQANQLREDSPVHGHGRPVFRNSTPKSTKTRQSRRRSTPLDRRSVQASTVASRNRRVVLDDDDEFDIPRAPIDTAHASIGAEIATDVVSPLAQIDTAPQHTHSKPRGDAQVRGPRPRYDYPIPKELEGVHKALGLDNWNEYLVHMENLWTGQISGEEFAAKTKPLFLTFSDAIRRKMNNLMAMKAVVPVLEQRAGEEEQRSREEQRG